MVGILDFLRGAEVQNRLATAGQPAPSGNALAFWNGGVDEAVANNGDRLVRLPDGSVQRTSAKYGWTEIDRQGGAPSGGGGLLGMMGGNDMPEPSHPGAIAPQSSGGSHTQSGGGILSGLGGLLEGILGVPDQRKRVAAEQWLQNLGYNASASKLIAGDPASLRRIVIEQGSPRAPNEYAQRAQVAQSLGFRPGTPEFQNFIAGRDVVKANEPPDAVQTLEWRARQAGLRPGTPEYQEFIRVNGGGVTNNLTLPPAENKYDETIGKGYGDRFLEIQKDAQTAGKALNSLTVMDQAMSKPGFYSGTGAGGVQYAKRAAAALGLDPNGVSDMETFNAMAKAAALDSMGGSLGTGFSNADRDFVLDQVPNLANSPEGNRQLIAVQRKLAERKQQVAQLARQYASKNNGRIDAGFDDYLTQWAEQNPLFPKLPPKPKPENGPERVHNPQTGPRQRARNPQTGEVIEWNGSQWERVQ